MNRGRGLQIDREHVNRVRESAGINRLVIENERVLQRKLSQSLWPRTLRWVIRVIIRVSHH
jgi:hypothetical protein